MQFMQKYLSLINLHSLIHLLMMMSQVHFWIFKMNLQILFRIQPTFLMILWTHKHHSQQSCVIQVNHSDPSHDCRFHSFILHPDHACCSSFTWSYWGFISSSSWSTRWISSFRSPLLHGDEPFDWSLNDFSESSNKLHLNTLSSYQNHQHISLINVIFIISWILVMIILVIWQ